MCRYCRRYRGNEVGRVPVFVIVQKLRLSVNVSGVEDAFSELSLLHDVLKEVDVGLDAPHHELIEASVHPPYRLVPCGAFYHELNREGIVTARNNKVLVYGAVY